MNRTQKIALLVLALAALAVAWLATRNRQPPFIPRDDVHVGTPPAECESCHGLGAEYDRGKNHPLGRDCTRCHGTGE